uniref:Uncharacterized protein n=1 Tax=Serinus canaria TaxID=9135 RepID=A0A8C9MG00_SERCA
GLWLITPHPELKGYNLGKTTWERYGDTKPELLQSITKYKTTLQPPMTPRNLRQESDGLAEEINFEDFLTIMSYFRPIEMNMDEEQLDRFRKEKLKCETAPEPAWAWGCWGGLP